MKNFKFWAVHLACTFVIASLCTANQRRVVIGDNVRLREEPNGQIIAKLNKDIEVEVLDST